MPRPFLWLGKRLAYIAIAAAGAALALFAYGKIATADITTGENLGKYTYPSSDCHEADADAGDPINIVFWDDASPWALWHYFEVHGGWVDNGGDTQYFQTNGWCSVVDGQPSSASTGSRYRVRHQRGLDEYGEVDYDPTWGDYSVAAARYEDWVTGGGCGAGDYAVPSDGFDQGRDEVVDNWVVDPTPVGHTLSGYEYWDNRESRLQCNGAQAASDGYVAFIQVWLDSDGDGLSDYWEDAVTHTDPYNPDTDGDGCSDQQEVGPTPALGGQRDPLDEWDFFDVPRPVGDPGTGTKDQQVDGNDALAVLSKFGSSPGDPLPPPVPPYDPAYDRSAPSPNSWNTHAPNGVQDGNDIIWNLWQFGHSCVAPD